MEGQSPPLALWAFKCHDEKNCEWQKSGKTFSFGYALKHVHLEVTTLFSMKVCSRPTSINRLIADINFMVFGRKSEPILQLF